MSICFVNVNILEARIELYKQLLKYFFFNEFQSLITLITLFNNTILINCIKSLKFK